MIALFAVMTASAQSQLAADFVDQPQVQGSNVIRTGWTDVAELEGQWFRIVNVGAGTQTVSDPVGSPLVFKTAAVERSNTELLRLAMTGANLGTVNFEVISGAFGDTARRVTLTDVVITSAKVDWTDTSGQMTWTLDYRTISVENIPAPAVCFDAIAQGPC